VCSSDLIHHGRRWSNEIAGALKDIQIGIVCLTPENLYSEWLLFESGALAKTVETAYVCPLLLDLEKGSVPPPLGEFQLTSCNKDDIQRLVSSINIALGGSVQDYRLNRTYERFWNDLEDTIYRLSAEEVPEEELRSLKGPWAKIHDRLDAIEKYVASPYDGENCASLGFISNTLRYYTTKAYIYHSEIMRLESMPNRSNLEQEKLDRYKAEYSACKADSQQLFDAMSEGLEGRDASTT